MDEYSSYKAKPYQYSKPSFEKPASAQQTYPGYTGYLGNDGLDFQESKRKEELRYLPHSQEPNDYAIRSWTTKEPDYPSDKDIAPRSINIQPCNHPVVDKELTEEDARPDNRRNANQKRDGAPNKVRTQFLSPQYGDRKQQSNSYSNYGARKHTEPRSGTAKIGEKDLPRSEEKKIIFNISHQTSHPTRDHISPDSVRYAKMSEDEAAQTFEARRKALINNLMKQADTNSKDGSASEEVEEKRTENVPNKVSASRPDKKYQDIKKKYNSSTSTVNKNKPRQAPVPIKSLGAELEKAKRKNKLSNAKTGSSKPTLNEEAISSIPSSAIPSSAITPQRQSFDSGENLPMKSKIVYKSVSPDKNFEKIQKRTTTQSNVMSPKLPTKKESRTQTKHDENTIQLKKLFTQQPKNLVDPKVYSKIARQEAMYQADDENYREKEQSFIKPRNTVLNERIDSERVERVEHNPVVWSPEPRHVKVSEPSERARTEAREEKEKKDDIKSKFIRRKRKISNEVDNQENLTEDYRSDEEIRPYSSLNEKGFESHHAYLHERALLQKRNRDIAHQHSKQQSKEKEIERCTFRPTIGSPPKYRESIIEKTKKWQIAREQQIIENQAAAIEKELNQCTFYPNTALANLDSNQHNFNDFLKRNSEWNQKRAEDNKRREEELFQKSHTSVTRSTHVRSPQREGIVTKRSCCQEKELAQTKPGSIKTSKSQKGLKGPVKQEVHHCKHHENEKPNSSRPAERPTTIINNLDAIQETQQDLKTTLQFATQQFEGIEDIPQVEEDISQTYHIIQNLKHIVTEKEDIRKSKENDRKVNIDLLLKTTGEQFLRESRSLEKLHQLESNRKSRRTLKSRGNSISPSRNQSSFFKEVPATSLEYDSDLFQGNSCRVTLKNNKYYVSQRTELHSDIKNIIDLNSSPSAKVSDFLGEGDGVPKTKSILVQRNSRESSAKKTKTVTIFSEKGSPTHTSFKYVTNDVMLNIEPQPTLNQRYVEIINQASQVTAQIGQLGYQTYMSDWNN